MANCGYNVTECMYELFFLGIYIYLDTHIFWDVINYTPIEFAKDMFHLNVISEDNYIIITKMEQLGLGPYEITALTSQLLMKDISDPKKYSIFKHSLKNVSLERLYHKIDFVG